VMAEQKKGQPIEMVVERSGKRVKLSVKGE
jgi:hypothetical protein